MANLTHKAIEAGRRVLIKLAPVSVVIYNGATASDTITTATLGEIKQTEEQSNGTFRVVRYREYLIDKADLTFSDVVTEPAKGWVIKETINSVVSYFEILTQDGGHAFTWSDRGQKTYRLHAKETSGTYA